MAKKIDKQKIDKILRVLIKYPDGIWIRGISKKTGLCPSTVEYYLSKVIPEIVVNIGVKDKEGRYFGLRIVKLKPKILETIKKEGVGKVYEFLKFSKKM